MPDILTTILPYISIAAGALVLYYLLNKFWPAGKRKLQIKAYRFHKRPGLNRLGWFAAILSPVWLALLVLTIWSIANLWYKGADTSDPIANRLHFLALVGLIGVLAGLVGTPLALIRVFTTERQTTATETGLTTDRINGAVAGLGAIKYIKQTQKDAIVVEHSEPNIEVRIGAIYALERIAQEELSFHIQILEILCAYIRHNAPASFASDDSKNPTTPRDDIQTALTVLGRRNDQQIARERAVDTPDGDGHRLDLRNTCLQQIDVSNLNFDLAKFQNSNLQGADLGDANLQGAVLWNANLQGARLLRANLQGAILGGAKIDNNTSLSPATLRGAGLREVDFSTIANPELLAEAFGDASATLPDAYFAGQGKLAHWSTEKLSIREFHTQWRAFQKSINYDPG